MQEHFQNGTNTCDMDEFNIDDNSIMDDLMARLSALLIGRTYTPIILLDALFYLLVSSCPLIIGLFVFFCRKRREHVRTGSLKSTNTGQTSPHVSRRVSYMYCYM